MRPNILRVIVGTAVTVALVGGLGAWSSHRSGLAKSAVGTDPGGVREGTLNPHPGNALIGFSAGCFWGAEQAFRKVPGVVATAVGYSGGTSTSPSYEVAHKTGHLETVLVEFNPTRTPLANLLKVFWTLPRSRNSTSSLSSKSSYRATIWFYNLNELNVAKMSRNAQQNELHTQLAINILPARPFYLAEEYHQQFDEKSGKDLCFASP